MVAFAACSDDDNTGGGGGGGGDVDKAAINYAGKYRDDLSIHQGCVPRTSYDGNSEPLLTGPNTNNATVPAGTPVNIPGYSCAGVEWTQGSEDTTKPIVILVHGNSSGVPSWATSLDDAYDPSATPP